MSTTFQLTEKQEQILNSEFQQPKTKVFEKLKSQFLNKVKEALTFIDKTKDEDSEEYIVYFDNQLFVIDIQTEKEGEKEVISNSRAVEDISVFEALFTDERKYISHSKEVAELYLSQRGCVNEGSIQIFDVESEIENAEHNGLFNEDKTIKQQYQFKMNTPHQAIIDIVTNLLSQVEEEYDSYIEQIEKENSMEENDDIFVYDDIIFYQAVGELDEEESNTPKLLKTLSMEEDTKYSEFSFGNNLSLDDSDSINFPFYTDKDAFSELVNENVHINRMLNYFKDFYGLKDFYIIAKSKDEEDYIFYTVTNKDEIEFFVLITRNDFNKIQIERLSVKNSYINRERFKKSISFKRAINDF
tara:strand:- start:28600 stop:29670 length:1071 start_codon:yes stop_codon:yes gene_type:complete